VQLQPLTARILLPAELEASELKEEFARRLGEQQRTIDILKVRLCCWVSIVHRLAMRLLNNHSKCSIEKGLVAMRLIRG
jgi:hypothetical protein